MPAGLAATTRWTDYCQNPKKETTFQLLPRFVSPAAEGNDSCSALYNAIKDMKDKLPARHSASSLQPAPHKLLVSDLTRKLKVKPEWDTLTRLLNQSLYTRTTVEAKMYNIMVNDLDPADNKLYGHDFNCCVVTGLNIFAGVRLVGSLGDAFEYFCKIGWHYGKDGLIFDFVWNQGLRLIEGKPLFPVVVGGVVKLIQLAKKVVSNHNEVARVFTAPGLFNNYLSED